LGAVEAPGRVESPGGVESAGVAESPGVAEVPGRGRSPGTDQWPLVAVSPGLLGSLHCLTDAELVARVEVLARREHGETALLVAHLAELDTRDCFLRAGYSSLFTYCREALGLSEHECYNRIEVARAARRFPAVLELVASGAVNLTTVRLLAPHLTPDNHARVLGSARGKKRSEVEEIVAMLAPFPEVPPSIRKLPAPRPACPPSLPPTLDVPVGPPGAGAALESTRSPVAADSGAAVPAEDRRATDAGAGPLGGPPVGAGTRAAGSSDSAGASAPSAWSPSRKARPLGYPPPEDRSQRPTDVTPLAPDRYRLQCTIGGATLEKLRLAQDMLRHAIPCGDEAAVLDRALTALLAELARTRFAAVDNPQPPRGTAPGSRHVPAEVKRAVWVRDLGRCAFLGTDGRRCNERAFVEFHHLRPYAAGGKATVDNIQLRCRRHNSYEARTFFDKGAVGEGPVDGGPDVGSGMGHAMSGRLVPERVRLSSSGGSDRPQPRPPAAKAVQASADTTPERPPPDE
jgi:hypothetical protein